MADRDQISIVLPTSNREAALSKTLTSYLHQEFVREVIVVDDGGSDGTADLVANAAKTDARLRLIRHDRRLGAPSARNTGVRSASGNWILFGEDDVVLDSDYVSELLRCSKTSGAQLTAGRIIYLRPEQSMRDARNTPFPIINGKASAATLDLLFGSGFPTPSQDSDVPFLHSIALCRKEIFDKVWFDERFGGNGWREETDFFIQARFHGFRLRMCLSALCFHLPRVTVAATGGQYQNGRVSRIYWKIRNTHRLLRKHKQYLSRTEGVFPSPVLLTALYAGYLFRQTATAKLCKLHNRWRSHA